MVYLISKLHLQMGDRRCNKLDSVVFDSKGLKFQNKFTLPNAEPSPPDYQECLQSAENIVNSVRDVSCNLFLKPSSI